MPEKFIFFLTTNNAWGGSEILWTHSAKKLNEQGFQIKAAAGFGYEALKKTINNKDDFFDLENRFKYPGLFIKAIQKLVFGKYKPRDMLLELIKNKKPVLAVISQGNNIIGLSFMQLCREHAIPFVTITQLVTESAWYTLQEDKINRLREVYASSRQNFFVSGQNLFLHEKMIGEKFSNSSVIYNPFIAESNGEIPFPFLDNGNYKIALVGRVEFFHKGCDLLLEVVKQEKWKNRNVSFSVFGTGPHLQLLTRLIRQYEIRNIFIKDHIEDVSSIWKEHHILLMPSRMEGQSLALIEAMRFKRAAVVTRVGGADELIEEGRSGFIADAATVQSIDDALERAWNNRTEWEQMGITAKKHIVQKHPADAVQYFNDQLRGFLE